MADPIGLSSITQSMIQVYLETAKAATWLASGFKSPRRNFHNSAQVTVDIERDGEIVAVPVQDLSAGYRENVNQEFENWALDVPVYREKFSITSHDLLKRSAGKDPFANVNFRANVIDRVFQGMSKLERKVRRAIELQASQIYQTGNIALADDGGNSIFALSYPKKATHFINAGTAWSSGSSTPLKNVADLAEVIRDDGLMAPTVLVMGERAFERLMAHNDIRRAAGRFDNRRVELGRITPMRENDQGAQYRGMLEWGVFKFELWTYNAKFRNEFKAGATTTDYYINRDYVVLMNPASRMDATFGGVPNIGRELGMDSAMSRIPELPSRVINTAGGMDLNINAWMSEGNESLNIGLSTRPLLVPVAIDTFGRIDTSQ